MPIVVRKAGGAIENALPVPNFVHVEDTDDPRQEPPLPLYGRFNRDPRISPECLEVVSIETIKPDRKQAKRHSEKQIAELARSVQKFGFNDPIEVDENYLIISGYGRYLAAKHLGMSEIPVVRYSHLSPAEKRAYAIAANKIAEHSEWDNAVLTEDFALFATPEVDIDARDTGFETVEIDEISCVLDGEGSADPADQIEELEAEQQPVTKPGEMWLLDQHIVFVLMRCNATTTPHCWALPAPISCSRTALQRPKPGSRIEAR